MKLNSILLLTALLLLTSCAHVTPQGGLVYHDLKYGVDATASTAASKKGEACLNSVLGLVASGDASIEEAKKNGNITEVATVNAHSFSVLFIYNKYCTIVTGN